MGDMRLCISLSIGGNNMNDEVFNKMPVKKAIMTLAIPTMLGQLSTIIYNLTDTYFVSLTKDADQIAAVTIAFPALLILMSIGGAFGIGSSSYISRLLGRKEEEKVKQTSAYCFYMCGFISICFTILGILFVDTITSVLGGKDNTFLYGKSYLFIIFLGSSAFIYSNMFIHMIRGEGSAKEASIGLILGTIVNIVFDYIMIIKWGLGVNGAALATVLGNIVSTMYYLIYLKVHQTKLSIQWKYKSFASSIQKSVLSIGIPGGLVTILMSISNIILNQMAIRYGSDAVAAIGISSKINQICILMIVGLTQGVQPLLGYSYAAKNDKRLKSVFYTSLSFSIIIGSLFCLCFIFFRIPLCKIFTQNANLLDMTAMVLSLSSLSNPILGFANMSQTYFQAIGQAKEAFILTILRQLLLFIPLLFILQWILQFKGIILAQPLCDLICGIIGVGMILYARK